MTLLRRTPAAFCLHRPHGPSSYARYSASAQRAGKLTIGIRREDPQRIWERRCPLTPDAVHELVTREDVDVLVQPCERRVWRMSEMIEAGARPHPTLHPAHIVLGIKETPLDQLQGLTDPLPLHDEKLVARTHLMFSHTHKGQEYNMSLLDQFLSSDSNALKPTLIDYELLTDEKGKRTVGFGWYAGVAGALESLSALAHALLELGIASPFLSTPRPHTQPCLETLYTELHALVGDRIASEGTPSFLGPVIIVVTGGGKVAEGALDLLKHLPHESVEVKDLPALVANPGADLRKIYVVHALPQHYFVRKDGQPWEREHYYTHPDAYESVFHTKIAPYLTLLLHGAGWAKGYPRLMTNEQLANTLEAARKIGNGVGRFACVGDISCDIEGGLEFLPRHSTLSAPFFSTRPTSLPGHLPDVTMMAVDILPTALPRDASVHFSNVLMPYLKTVIQKYSNAAQGEKLDGSSGLLDALERATVVMDGKLQEQHKWLEGPLDAWRAGRQGLSETTSEDASTGAIRKKRVLMLGSGMVAGPAIKEIVKRGDIELVVASNVLSEAQRLTKGRQNASAAYVDIHDRTSVDGLIQQADLVVSLLPVSFHPSVAELCVKHRKHLVTASYISPAMQALHDSAVAADVILLNEIGLDPGMDHCSAISILSKLRDQGKDVRSFTSFCGGLPAPEHAEGIPLKYKFSWSPRGVLSAALNGAKFKLWDKMYDIDSRNIMRETFPFLPMSDVLQLEGVANRNSLPYTDTYSLGHIDNLRTLVRGTIRYPGFYALMNSFKAIGLLQTDVLISPRGWSDLVRCSLEALLQSPASSRLSDFIPKEDATDELWQALDWLGITAESTSSILVSLPTEPTAPIDLFTTVLAHKLRYLPGERDLVLLHHEIVARSPASSTSGAGWVDEEIHTSSFITYGTADESAMSRTVGLPLAFAVRAVLGGAIVTRGVCGPGAESAIWRRVLEGLDTVGLGMRETVRRRFVGEGEGGIVERALLQKDAQ